MKLVDYSLVLIDGKRYLTFPFLEALGLKMMLSSSDVYKFDDSVSAKVHDLQEAYAFFETEKSQVFAGCQVHGTQIATVHDAKDYLGCEDAYFGFEFEQTDGLLTDHPSVTLLTKFADCTPVVLFDPVGKVLASLHSGWRGTQQKITEKAVLMLQSQYGTDPSRLIVFVGPSILQPDFEVGEDLIARFTESHGDISAYLQPKSKGKYLFDMQSLLLHDLLALGIDGGQIYKTDLSTFQDPMMHSYRRDGAQSGRMLLFAKMMMP